MPRQAGREGRCPSCAAVFVVPELDPRTGLAVTNADPGEDGENPAPVHAYAAAGAMAPRLERKQDDSLVIHCPRCKKESPIRANSCPQCGLPFTMEGMTYHPATAGARSGSGALALGLIALPLGLCGGIGIVPALIAIILGLSAVENKRGQGITAAHIGVALGIVSALLALIVFANVL